MPENARNNESGFRMWEDAAADAAWSAREKDDPAIALQAIRLSYLAGFFDGEGSIYARNGLQVSAVQINRAPLLLLQGEFGGRVREPRVGQQSPTSSWVIYGRPAADALRAMFPYLIVKSEQAKLALQYAELIRERGGGVRVTNEVRAQREYLRQRIMRGRTGAPSRRESDEWGHRNVSS